MIHSDSEHLLWVAERLVVHGYEPASSPMVNRLAGIADSLPPDVRTPNMGGKLPDATGEDWAESDQAFLFEVSMVMESPNMDYNHKLRSIALSIPADRITV